LAEATCLNPTKDQKSTTVAMTLSSHNLPTDRAKELFKPSTYSGSLVVSIKNKLGSFRFEFFG